MPDAGLPPSETTGEQLLSRRGEFIMQNEVKTETTQRLPLQAEPVMRTVVNSAISGDLGAEACDNNNNPIFKCSL